MEKTRLAAAIVAAFGSLATGPLLAQQSQQLERVEITGSAIKRIEGETALPVTIIRAEELRQQGVTTVEQAAKRLAYSQSILGVSQGIGATTGAQASANLRGIGANKTLVLLNGRRIVNHAYDSGSVDLNAIPMAAIDRIEVLRDGASALYGTDAVGGVINFIMRRDFSGADATAFYEGPVEPGGWSYGGSAVLGFGSIEKNGFNILGVFDYRKQDSVAALDRRFARTGIRPDLNFVGSSGTTFPANWSQTVAGTTTVGTANPTHPNCAPPLSFPNPDASVPNCRFDFSGLIDIIPENEQTSFFVKGTGKLGGMQASLEYVRAENSAINKVAPTPVTGLSMPNTSPFYPGNAQYPGPAVAGLDPTQPISVAWRTLPAGQRTNEAKSIGERVVGELRGSLTQSWDFKFGVWEGKNTVEDVFTDGYVRRSAIQGGITSGLLNPFGPQSPAGTSALQAAKVLANVINAEGKVSGADATVTGELMTLPAGPLAVAVGAEYRRDRFTYELTRDASGNPVAFEAVSSGLEGSSEYAGSRNVSALFTEFNVPIFRGFDAQVALRHDKYSDFGSSTNPKIGLRLQPSPEMLFRTSFNTGFRAPSLRDIYTTEGVTNTANSYNDPVLCPNGTPAAGGVAGRDCGQQFTVRTIGPVANGGTRESLRPEKSRTITLGALFEPTRDISVGIDLWSIRVRNTISPLPEQAIFGDTAKYASRFIRCGQLTANQLNNPALAATCFDASNVLQPGVLAFIDTPTQNLGETKTRGIDLSFAYRLGATPYGSFTFGLDGTYVDDFKFQYAAGETFVQGAGRYTPRPQDTGPILRWRHVFTINWQAGVWTSTIAQRYNSGYRDENNPERVNDPSIEGHVRPYQLWDWFVSYRGIRNLTLTFGMKNLTGEDPPGTNQGATFQQGYDPRITDPLGRSYVARVNYKF